MNYETIIQINLTLHLTGGMLAIFLYAGLGRIFWIPMAINLIYWHAIDLVFAPIANSLGFMYFTTFYFSALLLWIFYLSGLTRSRWLFPFLFLLIMISSLVDLCSVFLYETVGHERFLEIIGSPDYTESSKWFVVALLVNYIWGVIVFAVIAGILFSRTLLRWLRGQSSSFLADPRNRVLIPIMLYTAVGGFTFVLHDMMYDHFYYEYYYRIQIAGSLLGWGWVAMELPFYFMYQRMLKRFPELTRKDRIDSYWIK
jgi:hypothetical protein